MEPVEKLFNIFQEDCKDIGFFQDLNSNFDLYVPICATVDEKNENTSLRLIEVQSKIFDHNEERIVAVVGQGGSGKTTTALHVVSHYWHEVFDKNKKSSTLPLYINLARVHGNYENILENYYHKNEIGKETIFHAAAGSFQRILIVLDSYEQRQFGHNLFATNGWTSSPVPVYVVVFGRRDAFSSLQIPRDRNLIFNQNSKPKVYYIQEFRNEQKVSYINKFVHHFDKEAISKNDTLHLLVQDIKRKTSDCKWAASDYRLWLGLNPTCVSKLPQLQDISSNPLLLLLTLIVLPEIASRCEPWEETDLCVTEEKLYEAFVNQWFEFQVSRNTYDAFHPLFEIQSKAKGHLTLYFTEYAKNLAALVLQNNNGFLHENYVLKQDDTILDSLLVPRDNALLLNPYYEQFCKSTESHKNEVKIALRNACLLNPVYEPPKFPSQDYMHYRFVHISFLEYFASKEVFSGLRFQLNYHIQNIINERSDCINFSGKFITTMISNKGIISKLVDRARTDNVFQKLLLEVIEKSAEISTIATMSSNAMTLLNWAGYDFSNANLKNVSIQKADLSSAKLNHAHLQGADLKGANFNRSILNQASLQGSNLEDTTFGERRLTFPRNELYSESHFFFNIFGPYNIKKIQVILLCIYDKVYLLSYPLGKHLFTFKFTDKHTESSKHYLKCMVKDNILYMWCAQVYEKEMPHTKILRWNLSTNKRIRSYRPSPVNVGSTHFHIYEKILEISYELENLKHRYCYSWNFGNTNPTIDQCPVKIEFLDFCATTGKLAIASAPLVSVHNLIEADEVLKYSIQKYPRDYFLKFNDMGSYLGIIISATNPEFYIIQMERNFQYNVFHDFEDTECPDTLIFHPSQNYMATYVGGNGVITLWEIEHCDKVIRLCKLRCINDANQVERWGNAEPQLFYAFIGESFLYARNCTSGDLNEIPILDSDTSDLVFPRNPILPKRTFKLVVGPKGNQCAVLYSSLDKTDKFDITLSNLPITDTSALVHLFWEDIIPKSRFSDGLGSMVYDSDGEHIYFLDNNISTIKGDGLYESEINVWKISRKGELCGRACIDCDSMTIVYLTTVSLGESHFVRVIAQPKSKDRVEWYDITNLTSEEKDAEYSTNQFKFSDHQIENYLISSILAHDVAGKFLLFALSMFNGENYYALMLLNTVTRTFSITNLKISEILAFGKGDADPNLIYVLTWDRILILENKDGKLKKFKKVEHSKIYSYVYVKVYCFHDLVFTVKDYNWLHVYKLPKMSKRLEVQLAFTIFGIEVRKLSDEVIEVYAYSSGNDIQCFRIEMWGKPYKWKHVWSKISSNILVANECHIGMAHSLSTEWTTMKSQLRIAGKSLSNYIPKALVPFVTFSHLLESSIEQETSISKGQKVSPLIGCNAESAAGYITESTWAVSVMVKKAQERSSANSSLRLPHMWILIEGIRNCRRFILKAHKVYYHAAKQAVIHMDKMDNPKTLNGFVQKCEINQWTLSSENGMELIRSIRDDQCRDDLPFNLYKSNCIEWCRQKLATVGIKGEVRYFNIIVPPSTLMQKNDSSSLL